MGYYYFIYKRKMVRFTINATPSDAIVTINDIVQNSITVESGTTVSWSVSLYGYDTQSGNEIVSENTIKEITLVKTIPTESNPLILKSGRKLYRHSNNEGSVIEFDQYGKNTKLYVPDAKFRDFTAKRIASAAGTDIQLHTPILELKSEGYLLNSRKESDRPFYPEEFLTDEQLQTKLDSMLNNGTFANDFTAKQGTDAILTSLGASSGAASFARSLVPTGLIGCNLPNIYELSVIWLESDNIDSIDPTINEYSRNRLGSPGRFKNNYFWTCTEVQYDDMYFYCLGFSYDGKVLYTLRWRPFYVLPVLEL